MIGHRLGVLDSPSYRPFINAFKQAWPWQADSGGAQWQSLVNGGHMRSGGQLLRIAPGSNGYRTRLFHNMPAQAGGTGRWRLRWNGQCTWDIYGASNVTRTANEIQFDFTANGSSWVDVVVRTIGSEVSGISLAHQSDWADQDAGRIYRRQFVDELRGTQALRFDEWIGILRSENEGGLRITSWESRGLPSDEIFYRFVPYEWMCALANEISAEPWICLPTAADLDHFRKCAALVRGLVPAPRLATVEYSTKTWDFSGTPQAHFCASMAREQYGTDAGSGFRDWYGMRATQMALIWKEVWQNDPRLRTVVQHQADWVGGEVDILTAPLWRARSGQNGLPVYVAPHSVLDVLTVHAQIDGGMAYGGGVGQIDTWRTTLSQAEAFNRMRDRLLTGNADRTVRVMTPKWRHYRNVASGYGMELSSYEVGNHLNGVGGSQATRDFVHAFSVSAQMGEVYAATFNALDDAGFDGPLCMSVDCRLPDANISHGLQRWLGDHNPAWAAVDALIDDEPVVVPEPEPEPEEPEPMPANRRAPSTASMLHCLNGHSLTDVIVNSGLEGWPGNLPNLFISQFGEPAWKYPDTFFKDTIPGSPLRIRWNDNSIARTGIAKFDSLVTTETVPPAKVTDGASLRDTLDYLVRFAENTISRGKGRKEVIMWAGWPHKDGNSGFGNFRQAAVEYGRSFRFFSEYATWKARRNNPNLPVDWRVWTFNTNAWWIKFFDDVQARVVPGITDHRVLFRDDIHLTPVGEYALSVFFYTCLYQKDARTLSYKPRPANLSAALDDYFKRIAWEVASAEASIGMGGTANAVPTFNPATHGDPLDPSYVHDGEPTPPVEPPVEPEPEPEEPPVVVDPPVEPEPEPIDPEPVEPEEPNMADRKLLIDILAGLNVIAEAIESYLDAPVVTPPVEEPEPVEPTPEPEPPVVVPPVDPLAGMRLPADIPPMTGNWEGGNLARPNWEPWSPSLVTFNADKSATLRTALINGTFRSGLMQIFRPTFNFGRVGAVFSVTNPNGVAAFFTYADGDKTECDFELVRRPNGTLAWALGLHMFANGQRRNPVNSIHVPVTTAQLAQDHHYEIDYQNGFVAFYIDGVEVGRYVQADLPAGTPWSQSPGFDTFIGTYRHTGWSGFTNADYEAPTTVMNVKGLRVPGL